MHASPTTADASRTDTTTAFGTKPSPAAVLEPVAAGVEPESVPVEDTPLEEPVDGCVEPELLEPGFVDELP